MPSPEDYDFKLYEEKNIYERDDKKNIERHPNDPEFVRVEKTGTYWEPFDPDKHVQDKNS